METTAGTTLASIPELVEMVILELPLRDVLLAQKVNRAWRNIIKASPKLQQALFMRPSSDIRLRVVANESHTLAPCTSRDDCQDHSESGHWYLDDAMEYSMVTDTSLEFTTPISINPILDLKVMASYGEDRSERISGNAKNIITTSSSEKAPWRVMLLTQPPMQEILFTSECGNHWHVLCAKLGAPGVTLQDLQETVMGYKVESHYSPLFELWSHSSFQLWDKGATGAEILACLIEAAAGGSEVAAVEEASHKENE